MHDLLIVACSVLQKFVNGFSLHKQVNDKQGQCCLPLDQCSECLLVSLGEPEEH